MSQHIGGGGGHVVVVGGHVGGGGGGGGGGWPMSEWHPTRNCFLALALGRTATRGFVPFTV